MLAFLWWGAGCISTPSAAASYKQHRRVWTATATAALLLFVLQLLAQLLYGLHLLPTQHQGGQHNHHAAAGGGIQQLPVNTPEVHNSSSSGGDGGGGGGSSSAASIAAVVLEALGLGSMEGQSAWMILLVSGVLKRLVCMSVAGNTASRVSETMQVHCQCVLSRHTL